MKLKNYQLQSRFGIHYLFIMNDVIFFRFYYLQDSVLRVMQSLKLYPLSEVVYTKRSTTDSSIWNLIDSYRIGPIFQQQFLSLGQLRPQQRIGDHPVNYVMESTVAPTGRRRRNLMGLIIPCGIAVLTYLSSMFVYAVKFHSDY